MFGGINKKLEKENDRNGLQSVFLGCSAVDGDEGVDANRYNRNNLEIHEEKMVT